MDNTRPASMSASHASPHTSPEEYQRISEFLYREARLADESKYLEWESLVADDMVYWVPRGEGDFDMNQDVSITADNRARLHTRIAQLMTGERHSQTPVSRMRRLISNIEVVKTADNEYRVLSNFVLYELRMASTRTIEIWPGRVEHRLRWNGNDYKMFLKKVMLIHGDEPLPSLAFII